MKRKIIKDFSKLTIPTLGARMGSAAQGLTTNAAVLTLPVPTPLVLNDESRQLLDLYELVNNGDMSKKGERDAQRLLCIDLMEQCATYLEWKTDFNEDLERACGFELQKIKEAVGAMPQVIELTARATGILGEMSLNYKPVYGCTTYVVQYRKESDTAWMDWTPSKNSRILITGLESRVDYTFRVAAVGAAGIGPWSAEAVAYAA